MSVREFILSDKRKFHLLRHLVFWGFWGTYFNVTRYFNPWVILATGKFPDFFKTFAETLFLLLPQTFLVYPVLYFVLPRYIFKQKYVKGVVWFLFFYFISMIGHTTLLVYIPWDRISYVSAAQLFLTTSTVQEKVFMAYLASTQGSLIGVALASSFMLFKHFYSKSLRNQELQRENSEAQLRLLMAQVHPHFMFNTLNNIYSQTQEESPKSAKMIMELSNILRYILDEGKKDWVPLENELQMIVDYINLEKIRYDKKLDLHYAFPTSVNDKIIAPLLLLPLVENCFKHGASKMIHHPWINIKAELTPESFTVNLKNGKKDIKASGKERKGTGIENVRRRLALLYPGRHSLEIWEDEDVFMVNLQIHLGPANTKVSENYPKPKLEYEFS